MVSVSPSAADPRPDSLAVHSYGVAFAPLVTEGCRPPREVPRSDLITTRKPQFSHRGTPCNTACFPHERDPVTGTWHLLRGTVYEEQAVGEHGCVSGSNCGRVMRE